MQGKTVVATGATSGIGEIAVAKLAAMGARIVFVARDAKRAEATLGKLEHIAPGRGHRAHIADLSLIAEARRVGERSRQASRASMRSSTTPARYSQTVASPPRAWK